MKTAKMLAIGLLGSIGSLAPFVDLFNRTDGALGNGWLGSTWSIASGVVNNTLTLGAELLANPGAEGTYVSGLAPNWQAIVNTGTQAESATAHGGAKAQQVTADSTHREYILPNNATVTAGSWYLAHIWANRLSGNPYIRLRASDGSTPSFQTVFTLATAGYRRNVLFGKSPSAGLSIGADINRPSTGAGDCLIDDASVKLLTYSSLFSLRKYKSTDYICGATITFPADVEYGLAGVVGSADDTNAPLNYVVLYLTHSQDGVYMRLSQVLAGVETNKASVALTDYIDGELIELRKNGTTYQMFYRGTQKGTDQTINDAAIINNTYCGMIDDCGATFGAFAVRAFSAVPTPAIPYAFTSGVYGAGDGVVSLRFDDGAARDYSYVRGHLNSRSLKAGFAVTRKNIGGSGRITLPQALTMQSDGHEIMCHSLTHAAADPTSLTDFINETAVGAHEMRLLGLNVDSFVQPGTWVGAYLFDDVSDYGTPAENILRQHYACYEAYIVPWDADGNKRNLPITGTGRYGAQHITGDTMSLVALQAVIDAIIAQGRGTEILFHADAIGTGGNISESDFQAFLDYVQTKVGAGTLTVLTPTQQLFSESV